MWIWIKLCEALFACHNNIFQLLNDKYYHFNTSYTPDRRVNVKSDSNRSHDFRRVGDWVTP